MKIKYGNTITDFNTELQKLTSKSCPVINKERNEVNISLQFDNKELESWKIDCSTKHFKLPIKKMAKIMILS